MSELSNLLESATMKSPSLLLASCLILSCSLQVQAQDGPYLANGIKIGEVDQHSAIVWVRLTLNATYNLNGEGWDKDAEAVPAGKTIGDMEYSAVGSAGEARISYWPKGKQGDKVVLEWQRVDPRKNFTAATKLEGLYPWTDYALKVETRALGSSRIANEIAGSLKTAPLAMDAEAVTFAVVTCQDFPRRDDLINGHRVYPSILNTVSPDFMVHAGDIEYYDKPGPWAKTEELAYYKWNRIFGLPNFRDFYRQVPTYFMKDDHDLLRNDCSPGDTYGEMTWDRGIEIFNENFPMGDLPFRTVRWGKDLQIWMMEGRDYRSRNDAPNGPDKTIWGSAQKQWFFKTFSESDAAFRILINPDPVVGPDRERKKDNHANTIFADEGQEIREYMGKQKNAYMINGDRHWQYVTVDDETGAREYSCGAGSDMHAGGFKMSLRTDEHQFLRIEGGFLSVSVDRQNGKPRIALRHHDVHGDVVNEDIFWGE
jgi:alkaline phosphatase D